MTKIKMGTGSISWSSKQQSVVALSTTEVEYVAAASAGSEIIWIRNLLDELGSKVEGPSHLLINNQSAISVAKNPEHHRRMKHLDLRYFYFWLRDKVAEGDIQVHYVPTRSMPADLLTNPLPRSMIEKHRARMGIC